MIADEEGLVQALMNLGFHGSVPLYILTTDREATEPTELWRDWIIPTYPDLALADQDYPFEFDDDDGTVYVWLSPNWRGVDFNRFDTPLSPTGQQEPYQWHYSPKGTYPATGSAELWIWNSMVNLAHWSTVEDPNVASLATRSYQAAIRAGLGAIPIALLLAWAGHHLYRRLTERRRQVGEIREIYTELSLGHDGLALDVLDLARTYPAVTDRFRALDRTYLDLARRLGVTELSEIEDHLNSLSAEQLTELDSLARLARAQSDSLWRARPIIERDPLWLRQWQADVRPLAKLGVNIPASLETDRGRAMPWALDRLAQGGAGADLRGLGEGVPDLARLEASGVLDGHRVDNVPAFRLPLALPSTRTQKAGPLALAAVAAGLVVYDAPPINYTYDPAFLGEPSEVHVASDGRPVAVGLGPNLSDATEYGVIEGDQSEIDVRRVKQAAEQSNVGFAARLVIESGPSGTCQADMFISSPDIDIEDGRSAFGSFIHPLTVYVCLDPARSVVLGAENLRPIAPGPEPGPDLTESLLAYFSQDGPLVGRIFLIYPGIEERLSARLPS